MSKITWKKSSASLLFFFVLMAGFTYVNFTLISPYVLAIFMGSILAAQCDPFYQWLRAKKIGPQAAAFLITLLLVVCVIGPVSLFATMAVRQAMTVGEALSHEQGLSFSGIVERIGEWGPLKAVIPDAAALEKQIRSNLQTLIKGGSSVVWTAVGSIPALLLQSALALLTFYFMVIDGRRFSAWVMEKLPLEDSVQKSVVHTFLNTSVSTIWATLAAAAAQASVMFIAYLVLGVPGAFLAAGATFIFSWVPMVGSVPVWVVGAIYLYTKGSIGSVIAMAVLGLLTGVVDNLVRPLVLKGRGEMHPLVSLVAIFGGVSAFGIFGVFVGPILASVLISLLEVWPAVARRSGLIDEGNGG